MKSAAPVLATLAAVGLVAGCSWVSHRPSPRGANSAPVLTAGGLLPSPRLWVGTVLAVDDAQGIVVVELAPDAPAEACAAGSELITRTAELRETGRLQASRQIRGRTLGTRLATGQPSPGDEVVWLAP
jgi:hypothetical protein